ncbi:MAG TPA: NAD(P)/FAD-dependent oxidoreductase [Vicinamibacteria bacterium]|nr:NAD(P)/FAD-dependent oxidoreductase [Vicinamibacteria bacterium]
MSSDRLPSRAEVVVLGGGPAGAATAALLARAGRDVLVLEKERFPRFHIGESLMPATYWIFEKLGMLPRLRQSGSPVKASVQFVSAEGKASRPFYFFERDPRECSYTWQVERAWLDSAMLENAAESGCQVRVGALARDVIFDDGRVVGVEASLEGGPPERIGAEVVVDATGLTSIVSRRLELRRRDPGLGRAAVFAHYENGRRDRGIDEGATIILHTRGNRGWFWYIPLSDNRISVGVVAAPEDLFGRGLSHEEVLDREIRDCSGVAERLSKARRISNVHVEKDYSYRADRVAGDGFVLVGDAFGFLDPIYSSGVFLALASADMAASSIDDALRARDTRAHRLGRFEPKLLSGMEAVRRLVYAFYTPGFSFATFVGEHPEHRDRITDILIGDVFKEDVHAVFADLEHFVQAAPYR